MYNATEIIKIWEYPYWGYRLIRNAEKNNAEIEEKGFMHWKSYFEEPVDVTVTGVYIAKSSEGYNFHLVVPESEEKTIEIPVSEEDICPFEEVRFLTNTSFYAQCHEYLYFFSFQVDPAGHIEINVQARVANTDSLDCQRWDDDESPLHFIWSQAFHNIHGRYLFFETLPSSTDPTNIHLIAYDANSNSFDVLLDMKKTHPENKNISCELYIRLSVDFKYIFIYYKCMFEDWGVFTPRIVSKIEKDDDNVTSVFGLNEFLKSSVFKSNIRSCLLPVEEVSYEDNLWFFDTEEFNSDPQVNFKHLRGILPTLNYDKLHVFKDS